MSHSPAETQNPSPAAPDREGGFAAPTARERDWIFWGLTLTALAGIALLGALEDETARGALERFIRHGEHRPALRSADVDLLLLHFRWWLAALPLLAVLTRWLPAGAPRGAAPAAAPGGAMATPLLWVALAAQLVIGGAFLTGQAAILRKNFFDPIPMTPDEIRSGFVKKDLLVSRALDKTLGPDSDVYVFADPGVTTVFLNYYIYPRRLYSPAGMFATSFTESPPDFWIAAREKGYPWLLLYRPESDPFGYGCLLRYPAAEKAAAP